MLEVDLFGEPVARGQTPEHVAGDAPPGNDDAFMARCIREPLYRQGRCRTCGVVLFGFADSPRDLCRPGCDGIAADA